MQNKVNNALLWTYASCIVFVSGVLFALPATGKTIHQIRAEEAIRRGLEALTQGRLCSAHHKVRQKKEHAVHKRNRKKVHPQRQFLIRKLKATQRAHRLAEKNAALQVAQALAAQKAAQRDAARKMQQAQKALIQVAQQKRLIQRLSRVEKQLQALNKQLSRKYNLQKKALKNTVPTPHKKKKAKRQRIHTRHKANLYGRFGNHTPINDQMYEILPLVPYADKPEDYFIHERDEFGTLQNDDILYAESKADECLDRFNRFTYKAGKVVSRAAGSDDFALQQAHLVQEAAELEQDISTVLAQETTLNEAMQAALETARRELRSLNFDTAKEEVALPSERLPITPFIPVQEERRELLSPLPNEEQQLITSLLPNYEALMKEAETFDTQARKLVTLIEAPTTLQELNETIEALEKTHTQFCNHITALQQGPLMRRLKELHSTHTIVVTLQEAEHPNITDLMKAAQMKAGEIGAQKAGEIEKAVHNALLHKAHEAPKSLYTLQFNDKGSPIFTLGSLTLDAQGDKAGFLKALPTVEDHHLTLLGKELARLTKNDKERTAALTHIFNAIYSPSANNLHKAKGKLLMQPTLTSFENKADAYYKLFIKEA